MLSGENFIHRLRRLDVTYRSYASYETYMSHLNSLRNQPQLLGYLHRLGPPLCAQLVEQAA